MKKSIILKFNNQQAYDKHFINWDGIRPTQVRDETVVRRYIPKNMVLVSVDSRKQLTTRGQWPKIIKYSITVKKRRMLK